MAKSPASFFTLYNLIWNAAITAHETLVLHAIYSFYGQNKCSWPPYSDLIRMTKLSRAAIYRAIKHLESPEVGILTVKRRKVKANKNSTSVYYINAAALAAIQKPRDEPESVDNEPMFPGETSSALPESSSALPDTCDVSRRAPNGPSSAQNSPPNGPEQPKRKTGGVASQPRGNRQAERHTPSLPPAESRPIPPALVELLENAKSRLLDLKPTQNQQKADRRLLNHFLTLPGLTTDHVCEAVLAPQFKGLTSLSWGLLTSDTIAKDQQTSYWQRFCDELILVIGKSNKLTRFLKGIESDKEYTRIVSLDDLNDHCLETKDASVLHHFKVVMENDRSDEVKRLARSYLERLTSTLRTSSN